MYHGIRPSWLEVLGSATGFSCFMLHCFHFVIWLLPPTSYPTAEMFNQSVAPADKISLDSITSSNVKQTMLSSKLEDFQFQGVLRMSTSISPSFISMAVGCLCIGLHFEPNVARKWWLLELDTSVAPSAPRLDLSWTTRPLCFHLQKSRRCSTSP